MFSRKPWVRDIRYLEHLSGVVVDERRDSLHTASAGEPPDGGLGDALDGGSAALLRVSLDSDLADSLAALSLSCHVINN